MTYDFYLPDYNLLIEYNGKQHYKSNSIFYNGVKNSFHKQLHHDWLKRKYANKNGFNYLVIDYKDFNKISEKIEDFIKKIDKK